MKMYVIQSKHGIMMNVSENLKNQLIGVLVKKITGGILVRMIVSVIKNAKFRVIRY